MGIEHVALGTTTINTVDLGTLATSVATLNGRTALRIAFLPMGGQNLTFAPKPGNPTTVQKYDGPEAKEFFSAMKIEPAMLPKDGWAVLPLEPIRQTLDNKGIDALKPMARLFSSATITLSQPPTPNPQCSFIEIATKWGARTIDERITADRTAIIGEKGLRANAPQPY